MFCGRWNPPCVGHRSWRHRHESGAILLLDGNVQAALLAFRGSMATSHAGALLHAFRAYYNYKAENRSSVRQPYLYFVDFGLDNRSRRGIVFDMPRRVVHEGPFTVAHGSGSSPRRNGVPVTFSNVSGSNASSLGLYLTESTYAFTGAGYTSTGLRLSGLSGAFNDQARARGIVMHGAPYVSANDAGRSQGCPAVEQSRVGLIHQLAQGSLVFIYSPNDQAWLDGDPWVHHRGYPASDARRR